MATHSDVGLVLMNGSYDFSSTTMEMLKTADEVSPKRNYVVYVWRSLEKDSPQLVELQARMTSELGPDAWALICSESGFLEANPCLDV